MSQQFQVYSRAGCHLCEEMIDHLNVLKKDYTFGFEIIEITGNPDLEDRFGVKVPVLMHNDSEICHYFLDVKLLIEHLKT
ncbi:MAG: glutaredoxin family protein [Gammaproteobacteria bacterium]|nr:glutaredoxin family protein [Gammaproteobacteria bacterium]